MNNSDNIPEDKYFYARDGTVFTNMRDLYEKLEHVDTETFNHHVRNGDFAKWVKHVFEEHHLARNIKRAESREEILRHVFIRLFT